MKIFVFDCLPPYIVLLTGPVSSQIILLGTTMVSAPYTFLDKKHLPINNAGTLWDRGKQMDKSAAFGRNFVRFNTLVHLFDWNRPV